ncbi:MAG: type II toxin-antitoxin system RelE/ParE family toxin [Candidatus Omnitrophota bacterium]|jgi:plasmid stabilization system protein ParE|nr:type II toxin-antitoxin system RelE/ParE family toxin [Candidatus Omnitrophota bacterium]
MKYSLIIRPEAEADLQDAFQWYQQQKTGFGVRFLQSVGVSLSLINRSPIMFPSIHQEIRRALIRRFPYGIFYFLAEKKIIVIAVFHVSRHPKRWQKRK